MPSYRSFFSIAALALVMPAGAALANQLGCDGKNLLTELKAKDAAAYSRIQSAASANKNGKTLLWKIQNEEFPERPASYLFGTLHVTDQRVLALSPAVMDALSYSARVALEVDETSPERTQEAIATMRTAVLPASGPKLETLLAKADAARATQMMTRAGLPGELIQRVKPWVAMLVSTTSDCEQQRLKHGKLSLDSQLAQLAENRGVGSFGLESTEMQYSALAELPDADQVSLLKATLAGYDRIDDLTETMVQLYLAHNLGAMWPVQAELARTHGANVAALEAYRHNVLEDRNVRMRDRTMMHLANGGVFIAVGAMHLPGDTGMVELFREAGYKLTPIE